MAAFVERYRITETPAPRSTDTRVEVIQHGPLREAECHLAEVLVKFAQWLHVCAKELSSGESSCFILVDTLQVAVDELDGRNRGLLSHIEVDHEYERRRQQFPKVCRQAVIAANAIRQVRRQVAECQKLGMETATATPLIHMIDQTIILFFTVARGLERDNQDMRDCICDAMNKFENRWCKMENILTDSCYSLPAETGKALLQTVSLLGGAVYAIYMMVEMVFNIVPEESKIPEGHSFFSANTTISLLDASQPLLAPSQEPLSRLSPQRLSSVSMPKRPQTHWLKSLFVRH